jgi:hypothetical protein
MYFSLIAIINSNKYFINSDNNFNNNYFINSNNKISKNNKQSMISNITI